MARSRWGSGRLLARRRGSDRLKGVCACVLGGLGWSACNDGFETGSGDSFGSFAVVGGGAGFFCGPELADADADGISDLTEGIDDADGDTLPNYRDLDADGDGLSDRVEVGDPCNPNTCGTNLTFLTADSDADGVLDSAEASVCTPVELQTSSTTQSAATSSTQTSTASTTGMSQMSTSTSTGTTATTGTLQTGNDSTGTTGSLGEGGANPGAGGATTGESGAAGATNENDSGGAAGAALD